MKYPAEFVCLPQASLVAICLPRCGALHCYVPHHAHPFEGLVGVLLCATASYSKQQMRNSMQCFLLMIHVCMVCVSVPTNN